jgi:hypothetical protein
MTRIIISGDRNWYCLALAREVIKRLIARKALKAGMNVWLIDNDDCKLKKLTTKMLVGTYEKI